MKVIIKIPRNTWKLEIKMKIYHNKLYNIIIISNKIKITIKSKNIKIIII